MKPFLQLCVLFMWCLEFYWLGWGTGRSYSQWKIIILWILHSGFCLLEITVNDRIKLSRNMSKASFTTSIHLGESSSVSKDVMSILASFRSLRLSWSAAGDTAGGSSSSSCVGCRDTSIVSSVMQLKLSRRERLSVRAWKVNYDYVVCV